MTIVYSMGEQFWIEVLQIARTSVAANSSDNTNLVLEKEGTLLGTSIAISHNISDEALAALISVGGRDQSAGGDLLVGIRIKTIAIRRGNAHSSAQSFGVTVMVFLRKIQ